MEVEGEKECERDRQTQKNRDMETETGRQRQTDRDVETERYRKTERQGERWIILYCAHYLKEPLFTPHINIRLPSVRF